MSRDVAFSEGLEASDCADEESSPLDIRTSSEALSCRSPLRIAPCDGPEGVIINRENLSSVSNHVHSFHKFCTMNDTDVVSKFKK